MPRAFCTLFDANYLSRGLALYASLRRHDPDSTLRVFCMDEQSKRILDRLDLPNLSPIALAELERHDPELLSVKSDRTPVEYCWTATPSVCLYSLEREPELESITYLDADTFFFSSPQALFDELGDEAVLIVPHRYAPELRHVEATSGIYNVEMLTFRRDDDGLAVLRWWHDRCIEWCYYRVEEGKLGDQKYLDDWPERFRRVHVLEHIGGGLAPWNVDQYRLHERDGHVLVDHVPLVFYHFHALRLFRDRALFLLRSAAVAPARFESAEASFGWTSGYVASSDERALVWNPYLEALARALALVRSVEPRFDAGFLDPTAILLGSAYERAGAMYRRARRLARRSISGGA